MRGLRQLENLHNGMLRVTAGEDESGLGQGIDIARIDLESMAESFVDEGCAAEEE